MVTAEARGRDLYNVLDEVLGTDRADTLMASLPAYETAEFVTKHDIERARGPVRPVGDADR